MLALQPVDTAVTAFRPDPITQDEQLPCSGQSSICSANGS